MPPRLASLPSRSRLAGEHSDRLLTYGQVAGGNVSLTDRRRRSSRSSSYYTDQYKPARRRPNGAQNAL